MRILLIIPFILYGCVSQPVWVHQKIWPPGEMGGVISYKDSGSVERNRDLAMDKIKDFCSGKRFRITGQGYDSNHVANYTSLNSSAGMGGRTLTSGYTVPVYQNWVQVAFRCD